MNDQSSGEFPDSDDDDREPLRSQVQRAFMERARRAAEHEPEEGPSRLGRNVVALLASVLLAFGIFFVFDAFLSGMQRVLHMMEQQEAQQAERQRQEEAERKKKEPIPAYVVPSG